MLQRPFAFHRAQNWCLRLYSLQHGLRQLRRCGNSFSDLARFLSERLVKFEGLTAQGQVPEHAWKLIQTQVQRLQDGSVKREEGESLDSVFSGRVLLFQTKKGYRVTTDSVLLAYFASKHVQQTGAWRFTELGSGGGVVSIALAYAQPQCTGLLLELQPGVCARAVRNIHLNGVEDQLHVVQWDVARGIPQTDVPCDFVVCNPPYYRIGHGTGPQHPERALGMYESTASLSHFAAAAAEALVAGGKTSDGHPGPGRLLLVYPSVHTQYCVDSLAKGGFRHLHIAKVYHTEQDRADNKPNRILVQGQLSDCGHVTVDELPPMVVQPPTDYGACGGGEVGLASGCGIADFLNAKDPVPAQ